MDDYPGPNQAPGTPPPPAYQPPPPAYQPPAAAPEATYAPQPGYAPPAPPKKKKTWLWVVIGIVVLGLLGCCAAMTIGGFKLFELGSEPAASIDAINQAALDGDDATFEKYFDAESIARAAYGDFIDYLLTTPDMASLIEEMGEEEATRILREEVLPEATFIEEMTAEFSLDTLDEGEVVFPEYTVSSSSIENNTAELTIVAIEDGEETTYILGMVKETVGDEEVWRIKEIKNIAEMLEEQLGAAE
jgi:hypothetical protein